MTTTIHTYRCMQSCVYCIRDALGMRFFQTHLLRIDNTHLCAWTGACV